MKIKHPLINRIDQHHESRQEPPRYHLGCSEVGDKCERKLWLSFRWATIEKFEGRLLRLFRRGHNEESVIVSDLKAAGLRITHTGLNQYNVDFGCHVAGSLDGIIQHGVPNAPTKKHTLEIKTHNKKSFDALEKEGVEASKPMHYVQTQCYMRGAKIDRCLYVAVCKDDDRLYIERIKLDESVADKHIEKGKRIAMTERLPAPISNNASWYECKMCPSHSFCHSEQLTKEVNCRTCAHSTPKEDNTFFCERWAETIPKQNQIDGCPSHVLHPDLVPWQMLDSDFEWSAKYLIDGDEVINGFDGFSSAELIANPRACAKIKSDSVASDLMKTFNARVIG